MDSKKPRRYWDLPQKNTSEGKLVAFTAPIESYTVTVSKKSDELEEFRDWHVKTNLMVRRIDRLNNS